MSDNPIELRRQIAQLQARLVSSRNEKRVAVAERQVAQLEALGYELDRPALVETLSSLPGENWRGVVDQVKRFHKIAPDNMVSGEENRKAVSYAVKNGISFDAGLAAVRAGK